MLPLIHVSLERSTIGLAVHLSSSLSAARPVFDSFSDDVFACSASMVLNLLPHINHVRPHVAQRLHSGQTVTFLVPQADPLPIRVTERQERRAYFTLGEQWRWKFLRQLPDYPLKPHQAVGVDWLRDRTSALLADDMGLGKTVQAIAALDQMQRSETIGNALVVCPKSMIGVWEAELRLWAPRLCVVSLYRGIIPTEWCAVSAQSHVAITNYEAIRGCAPESGTFDLVVFDEIQRLKNPKSLNYCAAYDLKPRFAWGLSGTPLENHASDLAAILHLLDRKRIAQDNGRLPAQSFRSLAARYTLRRDKSVISRELPEIVEKTEQLPLSPEQRRAYDDVRRRRSADTLGTWIAIFNKLRDICDYDPSTMKSSKIDRAAVIVESIRALHEKVVVFSWRLQPLRLLYQKLSERHGGSAIVTITGQTSSTMRSRIMTSFQTGAEPFALLCSTRATAEGLTLTAANHVIFLNEWWNPATNAQARDRVYRIGQKNDVYVYRLRAQGTVESRLDELLRAKSALFDEIVRRLTRAKFSARDPVPSEVRRLLDEPHSRNHI